MTKTHFFIISPAENEDQEVIVELTETLLNETTSSFSMKILEGESTIGSDLLNTILSEIALTYVSGDGVHTEYVGRTKYDFSYNLGTIIS